MSRTRTIIKGAVILTFTGLTTRFMGFFYRIFLSRTLGETGVGIYQLIFPVYALGFSLTSAGIEIALSRLVARYFAIGNKKRAKELLFSSAVFTLILSFVFTLLLQKYSGYIANNYLHNDTTQELLLILSYVFPFAAIHSCIVGYYLGLKQTRIPAISQFIEQSARIFSVIIFYRLSLRYSFDFRISFAVTGLIIGELFSSFFCLFMITNGKISYKIKQYSPRKFIYDIKELLSLSTPITASRVMLNILQSIEAVSIPLSLEIYGFNTSDALSVYGVLTGMALPCILFPSAITNALSTMLLPTVSEIQAINDHQLLSQIVKKAIVSCTLLGIFFCVLFISFGNIAGSILFKSTLAGKFIITMAWMCPFLYTNSTLLSIINGIGKTWISFLFNAFSLSIRIFSIKLLIPMQGISGYLYGLLLSQVLVFSLCFMYLYKIFKAEAS